MALKRGAGSLSLVAARAKTAARIRKERIAARNEMFFAAMVEMYTVGVSTCQLLCWQNARECPMDGGTVKITERKWE